MEVISCSPPPQPPPPLACSQYNLGSDDLSQTEVLDSSMTICTNIYWPEEWPHCRFPDSWKTVKLKTTTELKATIWEFLVLLQSVNTNNGTTVFKLRSVMIKRCTRKAMNEISRSLWIELVCSVFLPHFVFSQWTSWPPTGFNRSSRWVVGVNFELTNVSKWLQKQNSAASTHLFSKVRFELFARPWERKTAQ